MIVVCKKNTKKTLKDQRYEAIYLNNSGPRIGRIVIKLPNGEIAGYSANSFTTINGKPLPKNQDFSNIPQVICPKFENLKVGDVIVCRFPSSKFLLKDKLYKITDLKSVEKSRKTYSGSIVSFNDNYVKFEGYDKFILFSPYRYRELSKGESRDLSLNGIFGDKVKTNVEVDLRVIDQLDNRDIILLKALSKSIIDNNRHNLSVIDWACKISSKSLGVKDTDFNHLLSMPLLDVLKMIESTNLSI